MFRNCLLRNWSITFTFSRVRLCIWQFRFIQFSLASVGFSWCGFIRVYTFSTPLLWLGREGVLTCVFPSRRDCARGPVIGFVASFWVSFCATLKTPYFGICFPITCMGCFRIFRLRLGRLAVILFSAAHITSISCSTRMFEVYSVQASSFRVLGRFFSRLVTCIVFSYKFLLRSIFFYWFQGVLFQFSRRFGLHFLLQYRRTMRVFCIHFRFQFSYHDIYIYSISRILLVH